MTKKEIDDTLEARSMYSMCKRAERREKIKRKMMDFYKTNPCVDCGQPDPRVLDFDHINTKRHNISTLLKKEYSWETILEEAKNCEVRCANCHRVKTAIDQNHYTHRLLNEFFTG